MHRIKIIKFSQLIGLWKFPISTKLSPSVPEAVPAYERLDRSLDRTGVPRSSLCVFRVSIAVGLVGNFGIFFGVIPFLQFHPTNTVFNSRYFMSFHIVIHCTPCFNSFMLRWLLLLFNDAVYYIKGQRPSPSVDR